MTVTFNPKTLDMFRNAQFESTRSIANLDGANGLKSNKTLGIWRLFRSNKTTEANNAVRAELLKSLGQSFGLSGMSEKNGRVTFSKEFMTKDRIQALSGIMAEGQVRNLSEAIDEYKKRQKG